MASKNGNSPFVNERELDITLPNSGLSGTIKTPIILTAEQFEGYMLQSRNNYDMLEDALDKDGDLKEGKTMPDRIEMARKLISPLVIDIEFPGVSLESIKTGEPTPFPAVIFAIQEALKPVVDDALNLKKL